jgi:hypothetical protein
MTAKKKPTEEVTPEPETVDAEPAPELAGAVDEFIPSSRDLAVVDPSDQHEVMLRMDEHDVRMLLQQVQSSALRKWVYELKDQKDRDGRPVRGLTVHAVQDIVQRMNWTGKAKIGLLVDANGRPVLDVERVDEDGKAYWMATAYAKDEVTESILPGASYEPVYMLLRKTDSEGKRIEKFDPFSRWKAIQKATRNAMGAFIPEEIEQSVIAMFAKDPSRVERIQTEAEVKAEELPPLDDETREKVARAEALYAEIRELGAGKGKIDFPPGHFNAYLFTARRDGTWEPFLAYLEKRLEDMTAKYAEASA